MFPEAFADTWIERLTRPGDTVCDPFSGRGTTVLSALIAGRRAVACDVNPVAYCLSRAKAAAPKRDSAARRIAEIEAGFDARLWRGRATRLRKGDPFFKHAFVRDTLAVLMYLRDALDWQRRRTDALVASLALGSLHGEMDKSPSYFSNQMPRRISTKPGYSVRFWQERGLEPPERDVFAILRGRLDYRYETPPPRGEAFVVRADMRRLPLMTDRFPGKVRCVITSPPYFDVTNFEEDQWLRLWLLGGPSHPVTGRVSRDDRHEDKTKYLTFLADMWRSIGQIMTRRADVVVRIGSGRVSTDELVQFLRGTAAFAGRKCELVAAEESDIGDQTSSSRLGTPGSKRKCSKEVDCHFRLC